MWVRHTLKGNENGGGLSRERALWIAQAVLAPSLYEAMLRSRCRTGCFAPGNVRNVGYAVRTGMVRTAYPTCLGLLADPSWRDAGDACSRRRIDGDSPRFFRWAQPWPKNR